MVVNASWVSVAGLGSAEFVREMERATGSGRGEWQALSPRVSGRLFELLQMALSHKRLIEDR